MSDNERKAFDNYLYQCILEAEREEEDPNCKPYTMEESIASMDKIIAEAESRKAAKKCIS